MDYMNCAKRSIAVKTAKEARHEAQKDESKIQQAKLSPLQWEQSQECSSPTDAGRLEDLVACFHPLHPWRARGGGITFTQGDAWSDRPLDLPCGQCQGCRIDKSREWAVRCVHEAAVHDRNSFITLTFNDASLPENGSLDVRHWQLFAKKLRMKVGPFRFLHCGEYTDEMRPHYHAVIFGLDFMSDRKYFKKAKNGDPLYTSELLADTWGKGYCTVGEMNYETAAYVTGYILKKLTPGITEKSKEAYTNKYEHVNKRTGEVTLRKPEYITMSRNPGLGADWFQKYRDDVYPEDEVILKGRRFRPPRFYDNQLGEEELKTYKGKRARNVLEKADQITPERLETRERILEKKIQENKRA